jgi:cytochrome c oxidase cbb3-type subunit 3
MGVMPNWSTRLDAATIKSVVLYVHSLGGGE